MLKKILLLFVSIILTTLAFTQNVAINNSGATADASGILDVSSTTKGVLVPRMDKAQKNAITTPANALLVYQTGPDSVGFHYYDATNTRWVYINTSGFNNDTTAWKLTGNTITGSKFLGTLNDSALNFRVNNQKSGTIDSISQNTAFGYASLRNLNLAGGIAGQSNSAFGYAAMDSATSATANTALGAFAMRNHRSGNSNTAVGYLSLSKDGSNYSNVAVGAEALANDSTGSANVAVGHLALHNNTTQSFNTALGYASLYANGFGNNSQGVNNTAVGAFSNLQNISGNFNTSIGTYAGRANITGSGNTNIGYSSGRNNEAPYNTYIGYLTGFGESGRSTGGSNTAIGSFALSGITTGTQNVAIGESALASDSSGSTNVSIGAGSMENHVRGNDNVAMGFWAGRTDTTASRSIYIGKDAGYNNQQSEIIAIGYQALANNTLGAIAGGVANVAVGTQALSASRKGNYSTAIGNYALASDTNNLGYNTAIGAFSGSSNLSGAANTSLGTSSLGNNITGGFNTAIGQASMFLHTKNDGNVAVGSNSLENDTTGASNTAIGASSMSTNRSGTNNTVLGSSADVSINGLTNASAIGYRAMVGQSNSMVLGSINGVNGATANTKVGISTITPDSTFSIANNFLVGSSGTVQYDNSVPVMNYMFKSGTTNTDRMAIAHSPFNPTWGLQYQDVGDKFNFIALGSPVLTADLGAVSVGIRTSTPDAVLDVNGTAIIGTNGTTLNAIIRFTANDDLPSIAGGATITRTYAVANATTAASVYVSPQLDLLAGIVIGYARVSAAGTVTVSFTNTTSSVLDQTGQNYYITVIQ